MPPPQLSEQRDQQRADVRRSILDAAEALLVESGLEGFSMRRLAERCGCTAPTLYHYFRDKTRLIDALLEERLRQLGSELRAVELGDDAVSNLHALAAAFARFGLRNPSHYQLLVMSRGDETAEPAAAEEVRRILLDQLESLVSRGQLPAQELEGLRQGLWCLLHGIILLQTTRPFEDWEPDLLERSLEALLRGSLEARE